MLHPDAHNSHLPFTVRRLETDDTAIYRELRLEGLEAHPESFGASWEDEIEKPDSWWSGRLESNTVFGGWIGKSPLLGVAGFHVPDAIKQRHKGVLWGMYVRSEARGTGLAASLLQHAIAHARPLVEEIRLTVMASNTAAKRLYSRAGFQPYGLERRALKVGDVYYDDVLMALPLPRA
jgi:ribosomal protein S18 acetylase RimI-like enzyme